MYREPESGAKATMKSPFFAALATFSAAEMQPPPEPPVKMPSCFARRRAQTKHSSSLTCKDVVENLQIHGAGEEILADAFDDVGEGLADFSGLDLFVVERADRIHADNFDVGILFLEVASHAGDGAAGADAADEVRNLSFGVLPDFRAGGAIVRFRIHGIGVLIGIEGIGNFAREFCGDGIIAARIFGLDGGGADDYFGAKGFKQVNFFARLLVGDSEDDFVAAHAGDERESQAGVAGSPFDDGAAGLEFAGAFGFFDHGDADAVFYRAAGIHVVGFDPDFGGGIFRQAIQADDGRVADGFEDVVALHARGVAPAKLGEPNKLREFRKAWQAGRGNRFRKCDSPRAKQC